MYDEILKWGSELDADDIAFVLRAYIHRFTPTNCPDWAGVPREDGTAYPVQFASDADWLANTQFVVTETGKLDRRHAHCYSHPTWPGRDGSSDDGSLGV